MLEFLKRRRLVLAAILMATAVALLVAACGGDEEEAPTAAPGAPAATATQAPTATRPPAPTQPPAATAAPTATQVPAAPPTPANVVTVALRAVGSAGQSGTATLTARGDQTEVVINITPAPPGVVQPDHIHDKDCTLPPRVVYPLNNVADGKSTTLVNVSLATLQTKQQFAVCVHKSQQEGTVYVSEGLIPFTGQAPAPTTAPTATPVPTATRPPAPTPLNADIRNFQLLNITIRPGTSVVWTNRDGVPHTATSGRGTPDGKFATGFLNQGQPSQPVRFDQVGSFPYFCEVHGAATMSGTITVTETAAASGTSATPVSTPGPTPVSGQGPVY